MNRKKEYTELIELIERCLDFQRWGFKRTYSSPLDIPFPYIIYDSQWCRVRFTHLGGDYPGQWSEMAVYYGRLHATHDDSFMIWDEEKCWCWHSIKEYALNFVDGLSPEEAIKMKYKPRVMKQFQQSGTWESITHIPERIARTHAVTWEHYGQRLFELFDLCRPDLWRRYRSFLTKARVWKMRITNEKIPSPSDLRTFLQ